MVSPNLSVMLLVSSFHLYTHMYTHTPYIFTMCTFIYRIVRDLQYNGPTTKLDNSLSLNYAHVHK